jgi:chemotaxis protein MotB
VSGGGGHGGKKGHKHEEHEEHEEHVNHEAWVIPYADMLTLLMALFLVLFAIGRTDLEKFKKLAESFREEFGGGSSSQVVSISEGQTGTSPLDGGEGVLDANVMPANAEGTGNGEGTGYATPTELQIEQARQEAEQEAAQEALGELEQLENAILVEAERQGLGDKVAFRFNGRGLVISLLNSAVLFDSGQATLQPEGLEVLQTIIPALQDIPNNIEIEGHTDNVPVSNARYRDNWDLSSSRATSVLRYMLLQGIEQPRLRAAGLGDSYPIADNATAAGRAQNRRVEIVIVSDISLDPALGIDG